MKRFWTWLILLALAGCSNAASPAHRKPNILLILADDVGTEVLGSYGGTSYATPRLDQLAASGMKFEHAYSMPVCYPSRISLLTGRYPFRLPGATWGSFPAEAESQTLAHRLKQAGYATAIAGKGQLTDLGTHVPLIESWPGIIEPGQTVPDLVDFSDFFPTLAEIGGARLPETDEIDGVSFAGRLLQGTPSPRAWAFAEHEGQFWLRTQRWKLYDDRRLFDMRLDPTEREPVPESSASHEATAARGQLRKWMESMRQE